MNDKELEIYNEHIKKEELYRIKFELMGRMLDSTVISEIINYRKWKSMYIYGGGYIGIQAYYAFSPYTKISGIIDRSGGLMIPIKGIAVYSLEDFIKKYDDKSPVIITPLESAGVIYQNLTDSVSKERIYYINELF